jgi:hypothetical protein
MIKIRILIVLIGLYFKGYSQTSFFEKLYGNENPDYSRSFLQDSNGEIYLLGFSNDPIDQAQIMLTKTDINGIALWTKYYGQDLNEFGLSFTETFDNNLLIAFEKHTNISGTDIGLLKVDKDGNEIWQNVISSPVNESPRKIIKTLDYGYAIVGFINDQFGLTDVYVAKVDSLGNKIWDITLGGHCTDTGSSIMQLADSSFYVLGDTESGSSESVDAYLAKVDKNGNLLWQQNYGNQYENGTQGMIYTSDNQIFIFGETTTATSYNFDYYTLLVDTSGNQIWQFDIGGQGTDAVFSAVEDVDGNFILTGYSNTYDTLSPIKLSVFKINRQGQLLWENLYGGNGINIGYGISHSQSNGLLVAGQTFVSGFDFQQYLLHLNNSGTLNIQDDVSHNTNFIFPNPFTCNAIYSNFEITNAEIFTLSGRQINISFSEREINFNNNLPSGVYIAKIYGDEGINIFKIVKK